jgi:hypothetical protein
MTCQNVIWLRNVHGCIHAFVSISVWHFRIVLLQSKSQDLLQCIAEVLYLQKYVKKLSHKEYCEEKQWVYFYKKKMCFLQGKKETTSVMALCSIGTSKSHCTVLLVTAVRTSVRRTCTSCVSLSPKSSLGTPRVLYAHATYTNTFTGHRASTVAAT